MYSPFASDARVRVKPVSAWTSETLAPGTPAPVGSLTSPRIVPLTDWAKAHEGARPAPMAKPRSPDLMPGTARPVIAMRMLRPMIHPVVNGPGPWSRGLDMTKR